MTDAYRAARQFERYIGYGIFDKDKPVVRDLLKPDERGVLVAIIYHRKVDGEILEEVEIVRNDDTEKI